MPFIWPIKLSLKRARLSRPFPIPYFLYFLSIPCSVLKRFPHFGHTILVSLVIWAHPKITKTKIVRANKILTDPFTLISPFLFNSPPFLGRKFPVGFPGVQKRRTPSVSTLCSIPQLLSSTHARFHFTNTQILNCQRNWHVLMKLIVQSFSIRITL